MQLRKKMLAFQRAEITEHYIYRRLARGMKDIHNRKVLEHIAADEKKHHDFWKQRTGETVSPRRFVVLWYVMVAKVFGLTFGVRLMERGEGYAQKNYRAVAHAVPEVESIIKDEEEHERELIALLHEERLTYIGSIVLGLNDALVELTGILAGLTFALRQTELIALVGLVTGIAASLSMASSEYLSSKEDGISKMRPLRAATYTGIAYVITVFLLVMPYLLFENVYAALGTTLIIAIAVIFGFTFYVSIAKDVPFWKRFLEMVAISLGVAVLSFVIGLIVRSVFEIDL